MLFQPMKTSRHYRKMLIGGVKHQHKKTNKQQNYKENDELSEGFLNRGLSAARLVRQLDTRSKFSVRNTL